MTDIEIAKNVKLEKITEIAKKIDINEDDIESYGKYKAKISNDIYTKLAKKENDLHSSHSVDEADDIHEEKTILKKARKSSRQKRTTK